jgi:hypothetical protein
MTDYLERELALAAGAVRQKHLARLQALGVDLSAVAHLGATYTPFGVARAEKRSGGLYEPAESGTPVLVMPVMVADWREGLFGPICLYAPVDLIAIETTRPASWAWRTGNGWALGADRIDHWEGEPLLMVATPLDWLARGGEAVCVLDWSATSPAWPLLRQMSELVADDLLAARLAAAIDRTAHRPKFIRPEQKRGMPHAA